MCFSSFREKLLDKSIDVLGGCLVESSECLKLIVFSRLDTEMP